MTTLQPRQPYSDAELAKLYPEALELQQVQIILRHGERTPVGARFQNTGLTPYWPYCSVAQQMKSSFFDGDRWDTTTWARRLETFERQLASNASDSPKNLQGPGGEINAICNAGELTDRGRQTTLALGQRLRDLYITRLAFLPSSLGATTSELIRLRATPVPRALESTQQTFAGLYPARSREPTLPPLPITQRSFSDETLFPNEGACKRFAELAKAFADRTAKLWNDSPQMAHINRRIGKYMPVDSPKVKVDSHPRLSGIMDTMNATLAHGPATKLPSEFYEPDVVGSLDRICTEEWFIGYQESNEYRKLGIGALVGDIVQNMVDSARQKQHKFKLSLSGCHDTTIAATIASLGVYDVAKDKWPPYTSSIAVELFRRRGLPLSNSVQQAGTTNRPWWASWFGTSQAGSSSTRKPIADMSPEEKKGLDGYFVRLRYNDQPLVLPACRDQGKHFDEDEGLCTLEAFKRAADSFTPKDWKAECKMNLGQPAERLEIERPPGL